MKSVTVREFCHNASLVDGLTDSRQLVVTARGKPQFVGTKDARPQLTRTLAEQRASGDPRGGSFEGTAFLRSLKK